MCGQSLLVRRVGFEEALGAMLGFHRVRPLWGDAWYDRDGNPIASPRFEPASSVGQFLFDPLAMGNSVTSGDVL